MCDKESLFADCIHRKNARILGKGTEDMGRKGRQARICVWDGGGGEAGFEPLSIAGSNKYGEEKGAGSSWDFVSHFPFPISHPWQLIQISVRSKGGA